ncbi:unnamed protein product [Schistosoma turkestanicum]|nr:unnamed protein product [Schistosoma turkestanicum]
MMSDAARIDVDRYGQDHLYTFWDELNTEEQSELLDDISRINFSAVSRITDAPPDCSSGLDDKLLPPDPKVCGSLAELRTSQPLLLERYFNTALKAVSENKVAVLLLAGGQGTRLGVPYPKGLYKPNLPSGRSLYQLQAERLLRVSQICKETFGKTPSITWYIMTSEHTKETTVQYFKSFDYFGHNRDNIVFFEQYTLPVFSVDGKILLQTKSKLTSAPDGNGGLYRALKERGILDDMKSRGIEYVQIYCVDNILVKIPDLHFIGYCIENNADCAAEVVQRLDPEEPIGVVGVVDGRYQIVEYSEISRAKAYLRVNQYNSHNNNNDNNNNNVDSKDLSYFNDTNRLVYSHGNICVHFMTKSFLDYVCQDEIQMKMRYHRAQKKVTCIDLNTGELIVPQKPNAIKFEKFAFDVFPFAKQFFIWEVPRDEQFSPLKNGLNAIKDCPQTARLDLLTYHTRLAKNAGALFTINNNNNNNNGNNNHNVTSNGNGHLHNNNNSSVHDDTMALIEISPLITYNGENLSFLKGVEIHGLHCLEQDKETGKPVLIPCKKE